MSLGLVAFAGAGQFPVSRCVLHHANGLGAGLYTMAVDRYQDVARLDESGEGGHLGTGVRICGLARILLTTRGEVQRHQADDGDTELS